MHRLCTATPPAGRRAEQCGTFWMRFTLTSRLEFRAFVLPGSIDWSREAFQRQLLFTVIRGARAGRQLISSGGEF